MECNTTHLRQVLTDRFSDDELRTLCFDLGLDYDLLPGEGKGGKARELVRYLERRERLTELFEIGEELRPDIPWKDEVLDLPKLTVPHNLPPRSEFIGREKEKERIYEALASRYPLVSIDGIGGIGKTSLALEVAYECLDTSREAVAPDGKTTFAGFIWVTAKDRDLTLNDLLNTIARTLDYTGIAQQPIEEKRISIERLLREQPYLLLVDNLETITDDEIRDFLLNMPEPSKALLTTREQTMRQVWAISLKGLAKEEAVELIRNSGRRLSLEALTEARDEVILRLYRATGGAPLAIKWAVGQIKQRGYSLDSVLAALHEARGDIFEDIFVRSWNVLTNSAQQVLMTMPLFTTSASRKAIEAASDVTHFAMDEALGALVEMSLIEATDHISEEKRRFSIHPLTRSFVTQQLSLAPQLARAMRRRLTNYFYDFVSTHGGYWNMSGYAKLELDLPNIVDIAKWAWDTDLANVGLDIFIRANDFFIIRGYWNEAMTLAQQAISVALEREDSFRTAQLKVWPISWIYRHRGNLEAAEANANWALSVFEEREDRHYIAHAKRHLGRIAQERHLLDKAESLLREALEYFEESDAQREVLMTIGNLAEIILERGNANGAKALCLERLPEARTFDDPERLSAILFVLGRVSYRSRDYERANMYWTQALNLARFADRADGIASCLVKLGENEIAKGNAEAAVPLLVEARDNYHRLGVVSQVNHIDSLLHTLSDSTRKG
jgi:tetratricopeptide (TPR) repeat protein